jgi:predicted membrane protein
MKYIRNKQHPEFTHNIIVRSVLLIFSVFSFVFLFYLSSICVLCPMFPVYLSGKHEKEKRYKIKLSKSLKEVKSTPLTHKYMTTHLAVFIGVHVTRTLVICVYFADRCLSFCTFSFGHCVVCSSTKYGF